MGNFFGSVWNNIENTAGNAAKGIMNFFTPPPWPGSQPQTSQGNSQANTGAIPAQPKPPMNSFGNVIQAAPPQGYSRNADGSLTNNSTGQKVSPNEVNSNATPQNGGTQNNISGGGGSQSSQSNTDPNGVDTVLPPVSTANPAFEAEGGAALNNITGQQGNQGQTVPNINYQDPNSRSSQINAITQNLLAGENATPQETQLTNEIAGQEQGLGDTLANNIETSGDEGILTGRNAAANAQYGGRIQNMTSLLAGLQAQRNLSLQGGQAALQGAENNVPPTQVLSPAQSLVSPFGGQNIAGSGNNFAGGQALGQVQAGENQIPLQQAYAAGEGTAQTIDSYLQENPELNPSGFTSGNAINQWLAGQVGDPKYQTLANYLTDYATKMAPLLSVGGSVTNAKLALQQALVNGQASGQTIPQVLAQLGALGQSNLQNYASGAQGQGTTAGGSSVANPQGGTNSQTINGVTYVQGPDGSWTAE